MGFVRKLVFIISSIFVLFSAKVIKDLFDVPPVPQLEERWWGAGSPKESNEAIVPFKIDIPQKILDDLQLRLKNHRPFVPPLEGVQQQYGINTNLLIEIVDFWINKYNWREREKFLNKFPQFKTEIQGLNIHFIHVKPSSSLPKNIRVLPIILFHGWPGSVREFYDVIPLLTKPQSGRDFVFEVIVPSLPGYGFSDGASKPGFGQAQMAQIFNKLMHRLGHKRYYIQGGNWGAVIVSIMGVLYPENILGLHSNACSATNTAITTIQLLIGSVFPSLIIEDDNEKLVYPLAETFWFMLTESGYLHIQSTKPDTVGVGLNDSPVGLAAYIIEKFSTWTNKNWRDKEDGGLQQKFTYTDLLDNVMIYWVTGSITTSVRLYSENFNKQQTSLNLDSIPVTVPAACAKFKNDLINLPNKVLRSKYVNLVQLNYYNDGGNFAAFELPQILANDVWAAVTKFEEINKGTNTNKT
ncbi:juvenile hormone epoxide hydrolase 1-like isoform X2 [Agrilus planipennis]|uniref:Epoxide hydrolase n=1 Tax=Agrilus planipennis TaxID=224129 RepID=A0A7F5R7S3_AGRPL|nr:juvenile hormone epoxide hydrolase 1-like isoform X2 [Agrilus planipennis]